VGALILASLSVLLGSLPQQGPVRDAPARSAATPAATGAISGRVRAAGSGVAVGALVVLVPAPRLESATAASWRDEAAKNGIVTDALGRFSISGITPGTYRLIAAPSSQSGRYLAAGYGATRGNDPGKAIVVRDGDDIRNADIILPTALAIEGRVLDESGEPVSRQIVVAARIMAGSDVAQRVPQTPIATDDLGRYRVYGLEPGEYVVAVENSPFVHTPVTWPGARNFGGWFSVESEPTTFVTTFHPSTLSESSAGRVRLTAPNDAMSVDITLIRSGRCQVSGTVLDSQGVPAAGTNGMLLHPAIGSTINHPFITDAAGRFQVRGLDPGDYRLLVGGDVWPGLSLVNGRSEFADMTFTVAGDVADLAVVTHAGARVSGRVVFADAPPASLPAIRVALRRADDRPGRGSELVATTDEQLRFFATDVYGQRLVRVSELPKGWVVRAVMLDGADITDVPTVFRREQDGRLEIVLSSRSSTVEGQIRFDADAGEATVYVFSDDRAAWSMSSPRTVFSDVPDGGRFSVSGLVAGRYYAIAIARDGFRPPPTAGAAFFDLLTKAATPFVIGDDERRTVNLTLWRWPE
jgi:protocatechuate 3,4-dioxygenase beta subunit